MFAHWRAQLNQLIYPQCLVSAIPIGEHTLPQKFSKMCQAAGIVGHKTNHGLRATASEMSARQAIPRETYSRENRASLTRSFEGIRKVKWRTA